MRQFIPENIRKSVKQYKAASRNIIYSILFIIPFLIIYAVGIANGALGMTINGGDWILRHLFFTFQTFLGSGITITLVISCIVILIGYVVYLIKEKRLRIKSSYFIFMLGESAAWAFVIAIIIGMGLFYSLPHFFTFNPRPEIIEGLSNAELSSFYARIVSSVGAGVFEELVFRVGLLNIWIYVATGNIASRADWSDARVLKAIGGSSLVFTLMHIGGGASISGLITIFIASLMLSYIYVQRGYGIAAGTHALYDIFLVFGVIA